MFRSSRIPREEEDYSIAFQNPMTDRKPEKGMIVVIHNNQFFVLQIYDENGKFIELSSLKNQLHMILHFDQGKEGEEKTQVGILTADHRDNWYLMFLFFISFL